MTAVLLGLQYLGLVKAFALGTEDLLTFITALSEIRRTCFQSLPPTHPCSFTTAPFHLQALQDAEGYLWLGHIVIENLDTSLHVLT